MADEGDWSLATREGSRRLQHREFLALSFRETLQRLEEMERFATIWRARFQAGTPSPTPRNDES